MATEINLNATKVGYQIDILKEEGARLEDYIQLKIQQNDWHGVADAAMDMREIEARLSLLTQLQKITS